MHYVVGFQFNAGGHLVALIRKERPPAQAGLWNGVGGKVEAGETPAAAMVREFAEETKGADQSGVAWSEFAILVTYTGNYVSFFSSFTDEVEKISGATDEQAAFFPVHFVPEMKEQLVSNVPWLLELALAMKASRPGGDGRPASHFVTIREDAP